MLVCWLWLRLPEGPRWVDPASGGLDHTFRRSQLSDGELHLLSEAGWAPLPPQPALSHIITTSKIIMLFTHNPYAQQMTVSLCPPPPQALSVKALRPLMRTWPQPTNIQPI